MKKGLLPIFCLASLLSLVALPLWSFANEEEPVFKRTYTDLPIKADLDLNLDDCIRLALHNNKEIKAKHHDIQAAQWKLKEAQPRGVPTFEYEFLSAPAPRDVDRAVESFFEGDITYLQRGKISYGSPLYTFGKITLAQELARAGIEAAKENKNEKISDVVVRVKKLYYGILLAKDLRELFKDAENHLGEEIARREEEVGPADPVEMVKLKLYLFEVRSRIFEIEKREHLAREGLRIQMGLPRATPFQIGARHLRQVPFKLKDFDYYLEKSQKFRPKSRLLNIGLKAKETQYRLEKRKATPDIGVGGFFEFGRTTDSIEGLLFDDDFNDPFNFTRAGVGLRIKGKFNPKNYRDKVKQAEAAYYKTALEKRAAEEGLALDLKEAYLDVKHKKKNLKNNHDAMKSARQYVFLTKTNVDIGIGDQKEYSESLQAYLVARGRYLEAIFNYNIAVVKLETKSGALASHH